eukprot:TRINITY_DN1834_c0_g1_i1.p1 TRINITY_DN1834_c0_g1~~TRINITY_DN1834_c0_g1_i1.p1  ORF type:complete len:278 (+),score=74.67 TRINITY_DN1834_c0_g1_i1:43-834(+)
MSEPAPNVDLMVKGLPVETTDESLNAIFAQYATVKSAKCLPVAQGKTLKAAFVTVGSLDEAIWIVQNVNGNVPQGLTTPIDVIYATPREQRGGKGGGMAGGKGDSWGGAMGGGMGGGNRWSPYGGDAIGGMMQKMMGMMGGGMGKGWGGDGGGKGGGGAAAWSGQKTRLCSYFSASGSCTRGANCTFAHGEHEIGTYASGGGKGGGDAGGSWGKGGAMGGGGGWGKDGAGGWGGCKGGGAMGMDKGGGGKGKGVGFKGKGGGW